MTNDVMCRSWFAVFNNPLEHGYVGTPDEICEQLADEWVVGNPTRTGAWAYCISSAGLHHVHMVLEDTKNMRFSAIKKAYALGMHFEPTKGNKEQAEDYINKRGKWQEKGEQVLSVVRRGEIKGSQGQRRDFEKIEELIELGKNPQEIMDICFSFRRYEKLIKDGYFSKRKKETPPYREIAVHWLVGDSGSGKTYTYTELCRDKGESNIYMLSDYDSGGFDMYCGEPILFLDEFKGQVKYSILLQWLQGYKSQIHCRYTNAVSLWNEVYITSIYTPDEVYKHMVADDYRGIDVIEQLMRRLTDITYCKKDGSEYKRYTIPVSEYVNRTKLVNDANDYFMPSWIIDSSCESFSLF